MTGSPFSHVSHLCLLKVTQTKASESLLMHVKLVCYGAEPGRVEEGREKRKKRSCTRLSRGKVY